MAAEQTLNEGQSLLDQLALPVKNAFGKDVTPDNKGHIAHVQKMMEDLQVQVSNQLTRISLPQVPEMRVVGVMKNSNTNRTNLKLFWKLYFIFSVIQERKLRCDELSDVRKLKLQQILQMLTCERDTEQVRVDR